ncbi:MAG: hypothetical protein II833_05330, partial [Pseudobutyrivibrio sp.]|nr:hypothetical protein [Pseudobutyrivibrio sp.]
MEFLTPFFDAINNKGLLRFLECRKRGAIFDKIEPNIFKVDFNLLIYIINIETSNNPEVNIFMEKKKVLGISFGRKMSNCDV